MNDRRERCTAAFLATLMVLSLLAIGAGSVAGSAVAETSIDSQPMTADTGTDADRLSEAGLQSSQDDSAESDETEDGDDSSNGADAETGDATDAHVGPDLAEAEGTQQVYVVFDQYDGPVSADRDEAIETLKDHAEETQAAARGELAQLDGVEVINTYWITNAVRAEVDLEAVEAERLAAVDGVRAVYLRPEYRVPEPVESTDAAPEDDEYTYGLEQINATETWNEFDARGEDVKVAVLDTGFDVSHSDLDLYTEDPDDPTYPGGWVEIDENGDPVPGSEPHDTHYHGTHVGGTIGADAPDDGETPAYGVAPNVDLMHGLVLPGGSGADSDTIAGFEHVIEEMDADVVSMSFGAGCGLFGPVYDDAWIPAINNAGDMGVVSVTSSGNSGEGCVGSPANNYDAFAIGASDENGDITDFSSGDTIQANSWDNPDPEWPDEWVKPEVSAPGADVLSAEPDDGYQELSGTSMAAPHVAGTIALMLSANPDLTDEEIEGVLEDTAWKPEGEPAEKDTRYGHGIVDAYNATSRVAITVPEHDLGDVNEDDAVNVQDVRLVQRYLYGDLGDDQTFNENLADLNRDDEVTTTDLNLLQRKVQDRLAPGEIEVSNLQGPDEAGQGETINVSADLENLGEEGALQEIELYVAEDEDDLGEGEPRSVRSVDMAPEGVDDPVGEPFQTTVTFQVDTSDLAGGDYHYAVHSADDSERDEFTILGSNFDVSNLDAPDEVDQGEEFVANATIANTGNTEDTQDVEFRFDDLDDARQVEENVTLAAGEETTVSFTVDTTGVAGGTYDHGVFTEDDEATDEIAVREAFFDVEITDAPDTVSIGEEYDATATIENTGDAPDEQEVVYDLGDAGGDVAVVDVAADPSQGEGVADVLRDRLDGNVYEVDLVTDDELLDSMDEYDTFVVQRFGSDALAADFLDELEDNQSAVYLDSYQGASSATYADGVYRLNGVRNDPAERGSEATGTSSDPVTITIEEDHPLFAGVGEAGDTVEVYAGSTTWGSWFGEYSGQTLADADYGAGFGGPSVAVSDDGDEVLLTAVGRDYFTDESDFTDAGNRLLANAVQFATTGSVTAEAAVTERTELVRLDPGESTEVAFTHTVPDDAQLGEANHLVTSEDSQDTRAVTIDVDRGHVEGTVFDDATDESIENATVEIAVESDDAVYEATTDAAGEYRIEDVPVGTHNVTVSAEGYEEKTGTVEIVADETVTKDVGLHTTPGSIAGTVTASDTGDPVENVTVAAEDDSGNVHEATTDAAGEYELEVPPGTYVVNVADTPGDYRPEEIVTVGPGEAVEGVDFQVEPRSGVISGYVTNAAGVPIEGATVVDADQGAFDATTDEDGYYEIEDLDRGTHALRATADGYEDSDISFVELEANGTATENLTLGTYFEVDELSAPDDADPGDEITVSAEVTNVGEQEATRTAFYFPPGTDFGADVLDYRPELAQEVTLAGGETTTVEFTYEIPEDMEPGEYEHGISVDEIASTTIAIGAGDDDPEPAYFEVSEVDGPASAEQGETVAIDATITNTGDEEGSQTVYLFWDGQVELIEEYSAEELRELVGTDAFEEVTLAGGESETVTLEHAIEADAEPGTHQYAVSTLQETVSEQLTVEEPDDGSATILPASPAFGNGDGPAAHASVPDHAGPPAHVEIPGHAGPSIDRFG